MSPNNFGKKMIATVENISFSVSYNIFTILFCFKETY